MIPYPRRSDEPAEVDLAGPKAVPGTGPVSVPKGIVDGFPGAAGPVPLPSAAIGAAISLVAGLIDFADRSSLRINL